MSHDSWAGWGAAPRRWEEALRARLDEIWPPVPDAPDGAALAALYRARTAQTALEDLGDDAAAAPPTAATTARQGQQRLF